MNETVIAAVSNEWMRRYIEEPEQFKREFEAVQDFLRQENNGEEPTYGQECAAYMLRLASEMGLPTDTPAPNSVAVLCTGMAGFCTNCGERFVEEQTNAEA